MEIYNRQKIRLFIYETYRKLFFLTLKSNEITIPAYTQEEADWFMSCAFQKSKRTYRFSKLLEIPDQIIEKAKEKRDTLYNLCNLQAKDENKAKQ